jgi:alanyl-tRNA synthetase
LLQAALCKVLGSYIKQAGSVVHPDYLRFDFAHLTALTQEQIDQIEAQVNQKIAESIPVKINFQTLAEAQQKGVTAFFGEKYDPEQVRSIEVPGFSHELCGGTHVANTAQIKTFKITSEVSVATGVRRIVAVTGTGAEKLLRESFNSVKHLSTRLKTSPTEVVDGVDRLFANVQQLQEEVRALKSKLQDSQIPFWLDEMQTYNHLRTLFLNIDDIEANEIREICEKLAKRQDGLFVVTSSKTATPTTISFVAYLSESVRAHVDLAPLADFFKGSGLKGGGKAGMIQGGGTVHDKAEFKEQLKKVFEVLGQKMR